MDWIRHRAWEREFDGFAVGAWEPLLRTGYLMTGDARDAEDLVQETLLKVARRWSRVRSMDHLAAYARRILINLVLHEAGRRSRQRAELWPQDGRAEAPGPLPDRGRAGRHELPRLHQHPGRRAHSRCGPRGGTGSESGQSQVMTSTPGTAWGPDGCPQQRPAFACCTYAVQVPFGIQMNSIIPGGNVMIRGRSCVRRRCQCR